MRSTREVLEDHLEKRAAGDLEADLATNYSSSTVLLSAEGIYRGAEGVGESADRLFRALGPSEFTYGELLIEGRFGFLEWSAVSENQRIDDGADSYLVEDGVITMQSVHYTVIDRD
jgi:hypothetical protein